MNYHPPVYKPQVPCPSCGQLYSIDYVTKNILYTWWCHNDKCGRQFNFKANDDWSTESEPTGISITRTKVTLKIPPQEEDILILVKGRSYNDGHDNDRYFYEEHNCPVNLFGDGIEVKLGNRKDPHRLFKYVKTEKL